METRGERAIAHEPEAHAARRRRLEAIIREIAPHTITDGELRTAVEAIEDAMRDRIAELERELEEARRLAEETRNVVIAAEAVDKMAQWNGRVYEVESDRMRDLHVTLRALSAPPSGGQSDRAPTPAEVTDALVGGGAEAMEHGIVERVARAVAESMEIALACTFRGYQPVAWGDIPAEERATLREGVIAGLSVLGFTEQDVADEEAAARMMERVVVSHRPGAREILAHAERHRQRAARIREIVDAAEQTP